MMSRDADRVPRVRSQSLRIGILSWYDIRERYRYGYGLFSAWSEIQPKMTTPKEKGCLLGNDLAVLPTDRIGGKAKKDAVRGE